MNRSLKAVKKYYYYAYIVYWDKEVALEMFCSQWEMNFIT